MNANVSLEVTLPADLAEAMRRKVEDGEYASMEAMLQAGLRNLLDRDPSLETWLREEVVSGHADYLADPDKAMRGEDVLAHLRDRRARAQQMP